MRLLNLGRLYRRLTVDQSMRIRHREGRFELHEREGAGWRFRGLYGEYADAERKAEALIRDRKGGPRRPLW
ncbi:hypothetical protein [Caulobacter sp. S45]|uniref:hypothetical protein n=1 Tax=Caulobacter sp. S45 TaxID=1641861 RepID=UPI0015767D28|nr:hypothetical protein [Caulobacter sp. S45]